MSKFRLEIITPDRKFFDGNVESLHFDSGSGGIEVLEHHTSMISVVKEGKISFFDIESGEVKEAFIDDGFAEVRPDETVIFTAYCDYETDITRAREKMEQKREEERKEHLRGISRQKRNRILITRAIDDLKKKPKKTGNI